MSERKIVASERVIEIGGNESPLMRVVTLSGAGEQYVQNRDERSSVWIPVEHRPAVALAILGGITDELALRVNEAILDVLNDRFTGGPTLHVINAVFGLTGA